MGEILLEVLQKLLGEEYTPEVEEAWASAYQMLAEKIWQAMPPEN